MRPASYAIYLSTAVRKWSEEADLGRPDLYKAATLWVPPVVLLSYSKGVGGDEQTEHYG